MMRPARSEWLVPAGLIALSLVPAVAGTVRLAELARGAEITAENARFFAAPLPVVLHIPAVVVYSMLGAFQFAPAFRSRRRGWHRAAGRILVLRGLLAALTGLWMAHFYPWPASDGQLVYLERLVFGSAMAGSIVLALLAVRRRDFASHGAWMMRGYAIGLGAGTQVLTHLPWFVLVEGKPGELPRAAMMGAGWVINVLVAEWIIRKRQARPGTVLITVQHASSPDVVATPARLAVGALPVQRRNARWKALGSEKPSRKPTWPADVAGFARCLIARSHRTCSSSFWNDVPSLRSARCRFRSLIASSRAISPSGGTAPLSRPAMACATSCDFERCTSMPASIASACASNVCSAGRTCTWGTSSASFRRAVAERLLCTHRRHHAADGSTIGEPRRHSRGRHRPRRRVPQRDARGGPIAALNNYVLPLWLVALGVVLLRQRAKVARGSHLAVA